LSQSGATRRQTPHAIGDAQRRWIRDRSRRRNLAVVVVAADLRVQIEELFLRDDARVE